jgi:catechol-2,3-dioxygenase
MTAAASRPPVSIVLYARDHSGLARFYAAVLRLGVLEEEAGYVRLGSEGMEIVLVQAPPGAGHADPPDRPRSETPIKPAFLVSDIEALRSVIAAAGGALRPAGDAWDWSGATHLDGHDPEGNIFQLRQSRI